MKYHLFLTFPAVAVLSLSSCEKQEAPKITSVQKLDTTPKPEDPLEAYKQQQAEIKKKSEAIQANLDAKLEDIERRRKDIKIQAEKDLAEVDAKEAAHNRKLKAE